MVIFHFVVDTKCLEDRREDLPPRAGNPVDRRQAGCSQPGHGVNLLVLAGAIARLIEMILE